MESISNGTPSPNGHALLWKFLVDCFTLWYFKYWLLTLIIVSYVKSRVMIHQLQITSWWMEMKGVQEMDKELPYRDTWLCTGVMEALNWRCDCSHGTNNVGMRLKTTRYDGRYSVKRLCGHNSHLMGVIGHLAETGWLLLLDEHYHCNQQGKKEWYLWFCSILLKPHGFSLCNS